MSPVKSIYYPEQLVFLRRYVDVNLKTFKEHAKAYFQGGCGGRGGADNHTYSQFGITNPTNCMSFHCGKKYL